MNFVFRVDFWFASFAHAAKTKCGSVLTPILKALSTAGNGGAVFIAVSRASAKQNSTKSFQTSEIVFP